MLFHQYFQQQQKKSLASIVVTVNIRTSPSMIVFEVGLGQSVLYQVNSLCLVCVKLFDLNLLLLI